MQNKKLVALSAAGAGLFVALVGLPMTLVAQQAGQNGNGLAEDLSEKLGISTEEVESAMTELREERHAEMEAQREAAIEEAVSNGELTERQVEILDAMHELREQNRQERGTNRPDLPEGFEDMSEEERETVREQFRAERQQGLLDDLNEMGLEVSAEELDELHELMQSLDLGGPRKGEMGPGNRGQGGRR